MFGTFYRCDSCGLTLEEDHPGTGWIGITEVLSESTPTSPVKVGEQHACSRTCAQRILMQSQDDARDVTKGPALVLAASAGKKPN